MPTPWNGPDRGTGIHLFLRGRGIGVGLDVGIDRDPERSLRLPEPDSARDVDSFTGVPMRPQDEHGTPYQSPGPGHVSPNVVLQVPGVRGWDGDPVVVQYRDDACGK